MIEAYEKEYYSTFEPKELVKIIDNNFYEAKRNKYSRFSVEWGTWSRQMNLACRERIESEDISGKEKELLKYVFIYWVSMSNVLELSVRSGGLLHMAKRKKFEREALKIKTSIIKEKTGLLEDISYTDLSTIFTEGAS